MTIRLLSNLDLEAEIVALFDDVREGWELPSVIPSNILAQLRERRRCRDLDRLAIAELRIRYRHLLAGGGRTRLPKTP